MLLGSINLVFFFLNEYFIFLFVLFFDNILLLICGVRFFLFVVRIVFEGVSNGVLVVVFFRDGSFLKSVFCTVESLCGMFGLSNKFLFFLGDVMDEMGEKGFRCIVGFDLRSLNV